MHLRDVEGNKHQNGKLAGQSSHPADFYITTAIQHPFAQPGHNAWPVGPWRRHHQMLKRWKEEKKPQNGSLGIPNTSKSVK
jgi:hypothetical protein